MAHPRVLLVGQALRGGGAETRFRLLAQHLFDGTADVAVLAGCVTNEPPRVTDLGWRGKLSYIRVIWRLRQVLKAQPYDVVMSFGMFPNIVSVVAIRRLATKPALVINEITRPIAQARGGGRIRRHLYTWLRRHFYPAADQLTANSIDGLTEACALAGIQEYRARRTPNIMDVGELRRRANTAEAIPEYSYFICIARLDFMKRIDTVIAAWSTLKDSTVAHLLIVGDGESRAELEAQVRSCGLQDKVAFAGMISDPMPLLKQSRGFILASEYEGFSNSVLEAMCLDVPVITSLCSSDAGQMCDQHAALGFEVGNAEQLAQSVTRLEASEELRTALVRNAASYRTPHVVPNAIRAYESLLSDYIPAFGEREGRSCAD